MNTLVIFLHGAMSSAKCWNYINFVARRELKGIPKLYLEYDIAEKPAVEIVDDLYFDIIREIKVRPDQILIIGHSYGGVMAIELANKLIYHDPDSLHEIYAFQQFRAEQVKVLTMSSPLGGSGAASVMKFFKPSSYLFSNVGSYDRFMLDFKNKDLPCEVYSVITASQESDSWLLPGRNDTVVTVESQSYFNDHARLQHKYLECNHFEVLLSPEVAKIVADMLVNKNAFVEHFSTKCLQAA